MKINLVRQLLAGIALAALALVPITTSADPVAGAIFTTDIGCSGVNLNIYNFRTDVYLDGGPAHTGAAGPTDGLYWIYVTDPSGATMLSTKQASVTVVNGEFTACVNLYAATGYTVTPNPGGEYKVWATTVQVGLDNVAGLVDSQSKTDNFKVRSFDCIAGEPTCPTGGDANDADINVIKFYDANANGQYDGTISNDVSMSWLVTIADGQTATGLTPISLLVLANTLPDPNYTVSEATPIQNNWFHTFTYVCATLAGGINTNNCTLSNDNPVALTTLQQGDHRLIAFGNVCTGAGGGLTLGFWSNKNGQALITTTNKGQPTDTLQANVQTLLDGLNLRKGDGTFLYTGNPLTYSQLRSFLLGATATNMANMLSAQLAAMELNVYTGKVTGSALIYVGTSWNGTTISFTGLNSLGFASVTDVMAAAVASLSVNGNTVGAGATRNYQEALKNALDNANNNKNFVQASPCAATFAQ